jgi:hypothetical protein
MKYHFPEWQAREWQAVDALGDVDVSLMVIGGGLSGVAAACAARAVGVEVCVAEPTHMLGGQAGPAAVSTTDLTKFYNRLIRQSGIWTEFEERLAKLYREIGVSLSAGQYSDESLTPNPRAVDLVLSQMCEDRGIRVARNARLRDIHRSADGVRLSTSRGTISSRLAIDATEDGWVVQRAGTPYRAGNQVISGAASAFEDGAPAIQSITQVAVLRRYDEGVPDELQMPSEPPPHYDKYRAAISRNYPNAPWKLHVGDNGFAGYRGLPDPASGESYNGREWERVRRSAINFVNDMGVSADFLIVPEARERGEYGATLRTLAVIHYLQVELGLPWSVATDEGFGDGPDEVSLSPELEPFANVLAHFPPIPYIRESARIVGCDVLTGKDIFRASNRTEARWRADAVAVGTYPADLHGGRKPDDFEEYLGESFADKPGKWVEGPFPIPLRTLIPASGDWLIAGEKNISASRLAASATRVHPTVFGIGQAAGVLAGLALRDQVRPRDVPTLAVQAELARQGVVFTPLSVRDVGPSHADFVAISIAVVHGLVDYQVHRPANAEPELVVDVVEAARMGRSVLSGM